MPDDSPIPDLHDTLRQYWGYSSFRPKQERVIRSILAGRDVAVIMPTGGGKSLCYQLPAILSGGTTVVVSPLIALMHDQAAQLAQMGIPAAVLNSSLTPAEQARIMFQATQGAYRLLYLSPERLARPDTFGWLARIPVAFFAIDEAHCISEWGHEFRPEYRMLSRLRQQFPDHPIAAFTASATQRVRHDILGQLQLREPEKVILSFDRPNLRYLVREVDAATQERLLLRAMQAHVNAGSNVIVYAPTIVRVEQTVDLLNEHGIAAVGYHGKMPGDLRKRNQELWVSDEAPVLVGTIAFGMGINKPNVRAVIHLSLPKSLEQYYQEAGRAGRDGEPADCALLWQRKDAGLLAYFIDQVRDPAERERAWEAYNVMRRFVEGRECRHRQICAHFGETPKGTNCGMCDVCADLPEWLAGRDSMIAAARPKLAPADPDLFALLAEWRLETARRNAVPAFVILNDASLADLCLKKPCTQADLRGVFGIGSKKAELYGTELLAVLAGFDAGARAAPRRAPERKVSPSIHTLERLREGKSIAEIAALDGVQVTTVVGRVSVLLENGMIELQPGWVAPHRVEDIKREALEKGLDRLTPIKEALPVDYSFEEIRLVVASLRHASGARN